ncbi:hypothetical protein WA171_004004 [Blastocystis sp. BT1]
MQQETIARLLESFDAITESFVSQSTLTPERKHTLLLMIESLRSQFGDRMNKVQLQRDIGDTTDRMNLLQRDILALEEEIANLATDVTNYRQCAQSELDKCTGNVDIQSCVEHVSDNRSHSSFRKGLQTGIAHDVEEITQCLESGLLQNTGNEIRRTKRSILVIDNDRRCELSTQDRILASIP